MRLNSKMLLVQKLHINAIQQTKVIFGLIKVASSELEDGGGSIPQTTFSGVGCVGILPGVRGRQKKIATKTNTRSVAVSKSHEKDMGNCGFSEETRP